MASQWFLAASAAHSATSKKGKHGQHPPGEPKCTWPPLVLDPSRDFDFSECFELAVLLPAPLLLASLVATYQIISRKRQLRRTGEGSLDWTTRGTRNERVARTKLVSMPRDNCSSRLRSFLASLRSWPPPLRVSQPFISKSRPTLSSTSPCSPSLTAFSRRSSGSTTTPRAPRRLSPSSSSRSTS